MGDSSKNSQGSRESKKQSRRDAKTDNRGDNVDKGRTKLDKSSLEKGPQVPRYFAGSEAGDCQILTTYFQFQTPRTSALIATRDRRGKKTLGPPTTRMAITEGIRECDRDPHYA